MDDETQLPDWVWQLVDLARVDEAKFDQQLEEMSRDELVDFYWKVEEAAAALRGEPYTDHMDPDLSEDGVADVALWVLSQGKERHSKVVAHPELVPRVADKPSGLLGAVQLTHKRRFGKFVPYRE